MAMSRIVFECLKCGNCCRHLFDEDEKFGVMGLTLFSKETKLFPSKFISSQFGVGLNEGGTGPKHVVLYQLNVDTCPHLSENNECGIHQKRPLACRSWPTSFKSFDSNKSLRCRFMEEKGAKEREQLVFSPFLYAPKEWEAYGKFKEVRRKLLQKKYPLFITKVLWIFDLKTKKWVRIR
jgi:Fe-S-cluster containining protein